MSFLKKLNNFKCEIKNLELISKKEIYNFQRIIYHTKKKWCDI
jgi:hypothetical protein